MSWSASTPGRPSARARLADEIHPPPDASPETLEQFTAARSAAVALADAVGRPEDDVEVFLSGHANPDHAPTATIDEVVTVSIHARPLPLPPSPPPEPADEARDPAHLDVGDDGATTTAAELAAEAQRIADEQRAEAAATLADAADDDANGGGD